MARKGKAQVPSDVNEQYYQISIEILSSFPKYRIPVDLFVFKEDIAVLAPYSRKEQRLTNDQVDEVKRLCMDGLLFVSRSDYPIYSEHIVNQLDLVLQDENLKDSEIAEICIKALVLKFNDFAQNTVKIAFDPLYKTMMVFTEWVWQDKHRLKYFVRRLQRNYTLANHSYNSLALGLWLWLETAPKEYTRRNFDRAALAILLHDIGMAKVPQFIMGKPKSLSMDEREKINIHPFLGYKLMQKVEISFDELTQAIMEHHERLDGSGYPQRSKGQQISKLGRLVAVVDTFCAMISHRPHTPGKEISVAAKELLLDEKHFDKLFTSKLVVAIVNKEFGDFAN